MKRTLRLQYNKNTPHYYYSCPYYGQCVYYDSYLVIPDVMAATALTIYFQFYHPDLSERVTNTKLFPFWRYVLWAQNYNIKVTNMWAKLIDFLCKNKDKLPLPPYGHYLKFTHADEFRYRASALLQESGEWDWVIPHLEKVYPHIHWR